ncbi:DUF3927 family protein [Escherichia albertii]|uniref:DUF3927 family protein n=1 Tax=Escherichia albertii TaxID=208962 RepID=UPI003B6370BC
MIFLAVGLFSQEYSIRHAECICWILFYKLYLPAVVILLLVVVMMDFTSRIISGLEAGMWDCGIVTLRWSVLKRHSLNNA